MLHGIKAEHTANEPTFDKLYPEILKYAIFGHCGDELGHRKMLNMLNAKPLLSLGLSW